jgi:hypothetical protein
MSPLLLWLSIALLGIPLGFIAPALAGRTSLLVGPGLLVTGIYAYIWFWMRPTRFEVDGEGMTVVWPMRRERVPRARLAGARLIDREDLRGEVGWGMRVGAGGLWGGFGWLYTQKRGVVRMYISRIDRFVWIETLDRKRPWLVTPSDPEAFVRLF